MAPSAEQPKPAPSGRRAWGSLSQAQIVAAALEIARTEGVEALTIRRLAADLGASRMALYRHVADKDALVDLVMNAIAEHDVVPPGIDEGPWQERLRSLAAAMRRQLAAYPGMVAVLMTRANHGPGALNLVEAILTILGDAGLGDRQAARHYLIFIDLVLGRLHRELHGDPIDRHRTASLLALAGEGGDHPRLRAAEPHLRAVTAEEVFDAELNMLIAAIAAAAGSPNS
ncbi:TetR/AcrR family transcriptional regulator C-terminal domain-containing protein [Nonomuraea sp. NPDC050643]|uniref:TetR/AcrR family transcriptional regulator n=1 Tax=Nonomuraea sp. NPDC050643 TaxID=3155660 RepID=UPI00340C3EBD